ncbi:hypothetical protein [Streptomyces sp. NPDC056721]|uniref:hypothetical protein n=1 Tax=unclassified Streptomyces TaxID=2593676 RepID=UPI0036BA72AC
MTDHGIDEPMDKRIDEDEVVDEAIGEAVVRSLFKEQCPDLAGLEPHQSARGWGNQLRRLGAELAVRLPRTQRAPDLLRKEAGSSS